MKEERGQTKQRPKAFLDEIDFCLSFDDKEEVGVGEARGEKLLASFVEGSGQDGENHFALCASDEVEAKLLMNELELSGHSCCAILCAS